MTDNEMIKLIRGHIMQYVASTGRTTPVMQKHMADQQGMETVDTGGDGIYLQKIADYYWGWPGTETVYDQVNDVMTEITTQNVETTFDISALSIQDPNDTSKPTASDVVNGLAMWMQKRETLRLINEQGVNIKPLKNISNPYFEDDRHRNEASPTFRITITHQLKTSNTVECTNVVEESVHHVPDVTQ